MRLFAPAWLVGGLVGVSLSGASAQVATPARPSAAGALAQAAGRPTAPRVKYDGQKIVRVNVRDARDLETLLALSPDIWSHRVGIGGPVEARVGQDGIDAMRAAGMDFTIAVADVQALIDAERARLDRRGAQNDPSWFTDFKSFDQINAYVAQLKAAYPALVSTSVIGKSLEGRDITAIRITGPGSTATRPAVFHFGGQHAREWASPMTVMYIPDTLLGQYGTDPRITSLVDNVEWIITPVMNPDGYVYTWGPDRLWRKNRRNNGDGTFGVDLNRNWGYKWGGEGASTMTSSETYRGPSAFSEPETQVMRDFLTGTPRIRSVIDWHSYAQLIMGPWGWTAALPPDHPTFQILYQTMEPAIESPFGMPYTSGPIYTTIYPASGGSVDWAYGDRGLLGLTIEVRPDTAGEGGFMLPPDQILPNAQENFQGALVLAEFVALPLRFVLTAPIPVFVPPAAVAGVEVTINNGAGTLLAGSGQLFSRIGTGGAFTASPLTLVSGSTFRGDLPGAPCGSVIQFYFQAQTTDAKTVTYPAAGASAPFSTTALETVVALADDFEADKGWTVVNDPSLTAGAWVRDDPVGTTQGGSAAQPEDDYDAAPGTRCWFTGQGVRGGAVGAADVDGGPTRLLSPVFDASGATFALLTYARWFYSSGGTPDQLAVHLSNDGGTTWKLVENLGNTSGWQLTTTDLGAVLPLTAQMRVRFSAGDVPNDSVVESAIDAVSLTLAKCTAPPPPPPACYANCNGDTQPGGAPKLDIQDFSCFQNKFALGEAYADCNADSKFDIQDFTCFQNKFAVGCP